MKARKRMTGLIVALSVALSGAGVHAAHAAPTSAEVTAVPDLSPRDDGREIAEAILFGSGEYSDVVATIPAQSLSQEVAEGNETPEAQEAINTILDLIEAADATVYEEVSVGFRSGDPYAAEKALHRLSDSARASISEYSDATIDGQGVADVTPNAVVAVIVAVIHVLAAVTAGNAVLFVNAAAVGNVVWAENWTVPNSADARQAELIGDLTEAFAS